MRYCRNVCDSGIPKIGSGWMASELLHTFAWHERKYKPWRKSFPPLLSAARNAAATNSYCMGQFEIRLSSRCITENQSGSGSHTPSTKSFGNASHADAVARNANGMTNAFGSCSDKLNSWSSSLHLLQGALCPRTNCPARRGDI